MHPFLQTKNHYPKVALFSRALGFLTGYVIFTTVIFFVLRLSGRALILPYVMIFTVALALLGLLLKRWLS